MKNAYAKGLGLFFSLFFFIQAFTQPAAPPSFMTDSLDTYVVREMERWKIPGTAVCIVKDGEVLLQRGYGVREWGKEDKVNEETLFMIGSNSKAFTATAVAMLAEEGKCSLDDPVKQWVPEFTMVDPWVETHSTLTDVLSHRVGMETFQGDFMVFDSDLSSEQIIRKIGALTPDHEFRTTWGYFNTGFLLAGEAIGAISGLSWADFLRQRLFQPLGMDRTLALSSEISGAGNRCTAHTVVEGDLHVIDYGVIDPIAPAGSISSSVSDMSRWVIALLGNGLYEGRQVIPEGAIAATRQPRSIMGRGSHPFNRSHFSLYGLGWELQDYEGTEIVSHTGGIHGFVTSVTLLPEQQLGIVVLTNTDQNAFYEALKWEILDAFLELPYRGYSQLYHRFVSLRNVQTEAQIGTWRDSAALQLKTPLPMNAYAGTYQHDVYGTVDLAPANGGLTLTFQHHPNLKADLQHIGHNRFLATFNQPLYGVQVFPFEVADGKVKAFTLKVSDFIEKGDYRFEHRE